MPLGGPSSRRFGGVGLRRGVRIAADDDQLPWEGIANCVLALDGFLDVTVETGVSLWADQSGQGNDVLQATTSKQPAYDAATGKLTFDGSDDELLAADAGFTGIAANSGGTAFVVGSMTNSVGFHAFFELSDARGTSNRVLHMPAEAADMKAYFPTAFGFTATDLTAKTIYHFTHTDGAGAEIFENGTSKATNATATNWPAPDELVVGNLEQFAYWFQGDMYSVVVFARHLSDAEQDIVLSRLGERWGITVTL